MDAISANLWREYFSPIASHIQEFRLSRWQYMIAILHNGKYINFSINADGKMLLGIYDEWVFVDDIGNGFNIFLHDMAKEETNEADCFFKLLLPMLGIQSNFKSNMIVEKLLNIALDSIGKKDKNAYQECMTEYCKKLDN